MSLSLYSDEMRGLKLGLILALLLGLCGFYGWRAAERPVGWSKCLADPMGSDGEQVTLSLYTVDGVDELGLLRVSKVTRGVPVDLVGLKDARPPEPGQRVSIVGHFRASDRVLVAQEMEVHLLRWAKEALGVVGLLFLAFWIPMSFRLQNGRLEEKWRTW